MGTTTDDAAVGLGIVETLNDVLLGSRDVLPKELNGRPRAPSDPRAASIRKQIGIGRANPYGQLVTVLECDLRDGVPFSGVMATLRQLEAHLEVLAVRGAFCGDARPFMALMRTETKAQARADLAQLRAAESPMCAEALAEVIREVERHRQASGEVVHAARRQLAVVCSQPRVAVGARRLVLG